MKRPAMAYIVCADADERLCTQLEAHLRVFERQGLMVSWHRRLIRAGMDVPKTIDERLNAASVILLLISVDFVATGYGDGMEMQRVLERQKAGEASVIPILLRPVAQWKEMPFGTLQALPRNEKPVMNWSRREDAFVEIANGVKEAVQGNVSHAPVSMVSQVWNIPYARNPVFTGREPILADLSKIFHVENAVAVSQPQAISGLGGIGKTQIAVEYAYRHRQDYRYVLWTLADTREALMSGYVTIAALLGLPMPEQQDQQEIVDSVTAWLDIHVHWLLVLDNADDLVVVRDFLPASFTGHILLTTRAHAMGRLAKRIEVETMSSESGALLLLRRAGILSEDGGLDQADPALVVLARAISEELGGLPLALDQAGAYIDEVSCSLQTYLDLYRVHRSRLLQERGGFVGDHPEPVATTWSLSFEKVERKNSTAAELLRLCAFLAPDGIPEAMLIQGAEYLGPLLCPVASDYFAFNETIRTLSAYSLLWRDRTTETLHVHRLVQAVVQDALPIEKRRVWMHRAVFALSTSFPDVKDVRQWATCERWLPHALVCVKWIEQELIYFPETADFLNLIGYYLKLRGRYSEAEPLYKRALKIREEQLGGTHSSTAVSVNNLAGLYDAQGRYSEAELLYERALEITEEQWGGLHPETARSLNNLASLYDAQGRYSEAEPLLKRALTIYEEQLGAGHPDTANSLNNLASLYKAQGMYMEAEPLLHRALAIREEQLGEDHPDTARSLNNLALLYKAQGKYVKAESLLHRALAIREEQLGDRHPDTAQSLNNLALLYQNQGKYGEAEFLLKRALEINEKQVGVDHPDIAKSLNNLALLYKIQREYEKAEPLYIRALGINEQQMGAEHPSTANSLSNLAVLYQIQGKYVEAELMYVRALKMREHQLGIKHPLTAVSLNNLASLYQNQKKYGEAELLLKRALEINEQQLGPEHPSTTVSLNNLALLYREQGRYAEAELWNEQALAILEEQLGSTHSTVRIIRQNYASLLRAMGRESEAEALENQLE